MPGYVSIALKMSIPDEIAQVLGVQGLGNAASVLSRPAEEFGNDVSGYARVY